MLNDPTAKKFYDDPTAKKKFLEDAKAEYEKIYGKDLQEYLGILISKYKQEGGIQNNINALFLTFIKFMSPFIDALDKTLDKFDDKVLKPLNRVLKPLDKALKPLNKALDKVFDKTWGKFFDKVLDIFEKGNGQNIQPSSSSPKKFDEKFANDKTPENLTKKIKNLRKKSANNYDKGSSFDFITKSVSNVNNVKNTVKKSPLEVFVEYQKNLFEYAKEMIETPSSKKFKDPEKTILKARQSIKESKKTIENIRQKLRSGTLEMFEQDLQKLSPQQRKEAEYLLSPEMRIKVWEELIKGDTNVIKRAQDQIKQAKKVHRI